MIFLWTISLLFSLAYAIIYGTFLSTLKTAQSDIRKLVNKYKPDRVYPMVSIIIVYRNEKKHFPQLLTALEQLDYPKAKIQIIFVNDQSNDGGPQFLKENIDKGFVEQVEFLDLLPQSKKDTSFKKCGIDLGIRYAKGEFVALTDGDCFPSPQWLINSIKIFENNEQTQLIGGYIDYEAESQVGQLFSEIIQTELYGLMVTTAGAMLKNRPMMCNGGNIVFRKKAYFEIGGYDGFWKQMSGDDEFLMHKMVDYYGKKCVFFNPLITSKVVTRPVGDFRSLYMQRKRWSSKWPHYTNWDIKLYAVFIFLVHLIIGVVFFSLALKIVNNRPIGIELVILVLKSLTDLIVIKQMAGIYNKPFHVASFMINTFLYPIYVVFFGLISPFGKYEWKNRFSK